MLTPDFPFGRQRRGGGGRKGSSCLTGAALQPGGNLTVNNLGGAYSSWAKRLGGENDPKYIHMAMTERSPPAPLTPTSALLSPPSPGSLPALGAMYLFAGSISTRGGG